MANNNNESKKVVYCLLTEWVCDGESGSDVDVYATLEDADKAFRQTIEEEQANDHLYELDERVEELDFERHTFCVYLAGCFSEDHFEMSIVEREVKN